MHTNIKSLFEPKSVAVIGASEDPTKIGYRIVRNILSGDYRGEVYPVNPKGGHIQGLAAYRNVSEIPGEIDVACIAVPAQSVLDTVKHCTTKGVKFGVIITSGFSEIGNTAEEKRIVSLARDHGMGILGPNIFGLYSSSASLNCTFGPERIVHGNVGIITQSGAIGLAMIGKTTIENIGLSAMVSVGNKSDIDEADLLAYLVPHERTQIILMYIEGLKDGERFTKQIKTATAVKPVIIIKAGRSTKGAIAAASHTGSLAGSDEVFDHVMKQCNVLRAESIREAFNWCNFLSHYPLPMGENTLIITNGGGLGVLAADACEKYGVRLYDHTQKLKETFSHIVPPFGSSKNPIDMTADAGMRDYKAAIQAALHLDDIHAVLGLYCEATGSGREHLSEMISENNELSKSVGKPAAFSLLGGEGASQDIRDLKSRGIAVFDDVYEAVSPLGAMYDYYRHLHDLSGPPVEMSVDSKIADTVTAGAINDGRAFLFAPEAQEIMKCAGIAVPKSAMAKRLEDAVKIAEHIGYPVVMKVVSKDILHKSDAGGVALDLLNRNEVMDAYQAIIRNARTAVSHAVIEGVEVAQMAPPGTEIIVGARRDKVFGPIVMVGLGGIYVEVMKDVTFRAFPMDHKEVLKMIKEIKSYPILLGVRGEKVKDIDALADVILRLGSLIRKCRFISDIEINPLMVYEQGLGATAVDVRILLPK